MSGRAFAAAAVLAALGLAATASGGTRYESRSVSVTKTEFPGTKSIQLEGKGTTPHKIAGCYARVPIRLDRRRAAGAWGTMRSSRTSGKVLFSWTVVGFKERARIVVPAVTGSKLACAPVTLGFDR